jgi:hypothetical protein
LGQTAVFAVQACFLPGAVGHFIDLREKLINFIGGSHGKIVKRPFEAIKIFLQASYLCQERCKVLSRQEHGSAEERCITV